MLLLWSNVVLGIMLPGDGEGEGSSTAAAASHSSSDLHSCAASMSASEAIDPVNTLKK